MASGLADAFTASWEGLLQLRQTSIRTWTDFTGPLLESVRERLAGAGGYRL